MTRRTRASRREAFRRHCALPVRYTGASTRERQRFMDALRASPLLVCAPTSAPTGLRVQITLGGGPL